MKRVLIVLILLIVIWLGYTVVVNGFENESLNLKIAGYKDIEKDSEVMTTELAAYDRKNKTEYDLAISDLNSAITKYKSTKDNYYKLVEEMGVAEETEEEEEPLVLPQKEVYDLDFLWTNIGLYAKKEGVEVTLQIEKDAMTANNTSLGYTNCNLKFNAKGDYIAITNFIDSIEADDMLGFEIRDFKMSTKEGNFVIYDVPLNNETLLEVTSQQNTTQNADGTANTANGTVGNETVSPDGNATSNTTNNTVDNSVTNTTTNEVSNNSTNNTSNNVANNTSNNTANNSVQ